MCNLRRFIAIVESAQNGLSSLKAQRDVFIEDPGVEAYYDGILTLLADHDDADEATINAAFFDHVMEDFERLSSTGHVTVYRAISVPNVEAFVRAAMAGKAVGTHWSYEEHAASSSYHGEEQHPHDVLLIAEAPVGSVDWVTSMQANFSNPYEHELFVDGPVFLRTIVHDDHAVATPNLQVQT